MAMRGAETDWFENLFGFQESAKIVTSLLRVQRQNEGGDLDLYSYHNDTLFPIGIFEYPSLRDLRNRIQKYPPSSQSTLLKLDFVCGDASELHANPENCCATFQVASQFNCLEFPSPETIPEEGITKYVYDHTQGPACAIACAPALVYRNYFVEFNGQVGQTRDRQIDCLEELNAEIQKKTGEHSPFRFMNGYIIIPDQKLLSRTNSIFERNYLGHLDGLLRIGIHRDTKVVSKTWGQVLLDYDQKVTQVYCAACPIGYNSQSLEEWEPFARMILSNSYEATFIAAIESYNRHRGEKGSDRLILTFVGGGVFENPVPWICDAIFESCIKYRQYPLKVSVNSFGQPSPELLHLIQKVNERLKLNTQIV